MDALRVYEARLGALGNHANKLSKRLSDMIKDGGTLIAESGPYDHASGNCAICGHCKQQLTNIHSLIKQQNFDLHKSRRRFESQQPPFYDQYRQPVPPPLPRRFHRAARPSHMPPSLLASPPRSVAAPSSMLSRREGGARLHPSQVVSTSANLPPLLDYRRR